MKSTSTERPSTVKAESELWLKATPANNRVLDEDLLKEEEYRLLTT